MRSAVHNSVGSARRRVGFWVAQALQVCVWKAQRLWASALNEIYCAGLAGVPRRLKPLFFYDQLMQGWKPCSTQNPLLRLTGGISRGTARAALVLALSGFTFAQGAGPGIMSPPANVRPPGLKDVGIEQRLNEQIPPDLLFRDETGRQVRIGDYFGKKPLILSLVYFRCPMLCSEVLSGVEGSLKALNFNVGKEFDVLTVSFDPKDTPEAATEKKADILKRYHRQGAENGWHFLTGSQESIEALTKAVGFNYEYDPKTDQFAHTTAIMILTPEGKIAQYYYGIEFPPKDIRLGLIQASQGKIGTLADEVILYCYHYDPKAGRYSAVISRIIQLAGGATILLLGAFLLILFRREPHLESRG